jgi:transposase InsO family protein
VWVRICCSFLPVFVPITSTCSTYRKRLLRYTPYDAFYNINALENAMQKHGPPKHIISDQAKVFVGDAFVELLDSWNVKPRFGAIGKHGSISVTERVIKTLKYEWLKRVPIIKDFDHLTFLCKEFESWYNIWRPHMTLDGVRPDDVYYDKKPKKPERDSKTVPCNIEHHRFQETRFTG